MRQSIEKNWKFTFAVVVLIGVPSCLGDLAGCMSALGCSASDQIGDEAIPVEVKQQMPGELAELLELL